MLSTFFSSKASKIIVFLTFISISFLSPVTLAGLIRPTVHSRANCINNESITWFALMPLTFKTVSKHYKKGELKHENSTGWETARRSAIVHWGEGITGGWLVKGRHCIYIEEDIYCLTTSTTDCSLKDGWL